MLVYYQMVKEGDVMENPKFEQRMALFARKHGLHLTWQDVSSDTGGHGSSAKAVRR